MRKELLTQAKLPFCHIEQHADESSIDWQQDPKQLVGILSRLKMDHAIIPQTSGTCYVLTADTICVDVQGGIHGKPKDHDDAVKMLKLWRQGSTVVSGFCIDKKVYTDTWRIEDRKEGVVSTYLDLSIPDNCLEIYLKETPSMSCAGAMAIEEYGFQFVKTINGSYSNILGLPMFEVRQALDELGFFIY